MSPLSRLKLTRGIATTKRVPDNFEVKVALAQAEYPERLKFEMPQQYVFRDTNPGNVLQYGQIDMKLITHPPEISNPNHISVHNTLPEFWNTR